MGAVASVATVPVTLPPEEAGHFVARGTWVESRDVAEDLVGSVYVAVVLDTSGPWLGDWDTPCQPPTTPDESNQTTHLYGRCIASVYAIKMGKVGHG